MAKDPVVLFASWLALALATGGYLLARRLGKGEGWPRLVLGVAAFQVGAVVLYPLLHETGHALPLAAFGALDLGHSDFLGWSPDGPHVDHTAAYSHLSAGARALVSAGGMLLPTLVAWASLVVWRAPWGRAIRDRHHALDLLWTALTGMVLFAHLGAVLMTLGLARDADYQRLAAGLGAWRPLGDSVIGAIGIANLLLLVLLCRHLLARVRAGVAPPRRWRTMLQAALVVLFLPVLSQALLGVAWRAATGDLGGRSMEVVRQVHRVTVAADGKVTLHYETYYRLRNGGQAMLATTWSGRRLGAVGYCDTDGRAIPLRIRRTGPNRETHRLLLPRRLGKGDLVISKGTVSLEGLGLVTREGSALVYRFQHQYGGTAVGYEQRLTLPAGARVLDASPPPLRTDAVGNSPVLTWERRLGKMEVFTCRVRYRLGG